MKIYALLFVILGLSVTEGAKILGIFPIPARSHFILGSALMRGLAEKGHGVTIISTFPEKKLPKNGTYKEIILEEIAAERERRGKEFNMFEMEGTNVAIMLPFIAQMMINMTEFAFSDPKVQDLIHGGESFDVVIVEQFMNDAFKGFAAHFNAPLVVLSTIGANTWVNILTGNPAPTSYIVDALLSYPSNMTLYERTANTVTHVFNHLLFNYYAFPKQKQIYDKNFPNGPDFYDDVLYSGSIFLLNSHPSTNQPVPYVPNMIDIGGYHVQPAKTLPEDLQKFLDESKEGVIYFSMGSNLKSSLLPVEKREAFLKTFSKLKQKVLWKWEEDVLPGQPKNVKLGKWLPQQEILAHPNVKLFITHGGLLSTTETIYHGVPVLAIPIAADQKINAQLIVNQGFGLSLQYRQITEVALTEKLNELLTNTKYAENAKRRSEIFHDRQVKPMDTATYWVEYVIRHKGAPHLKVAGVDLPWYKYMLLDVVGLIVIVGVILLHISFKVVRAILSRCFASKKPKQKRN